MAVIKDRPKDSGDIGAAGELFYALLNGKCIEEDITTSRGVFTVRYPTPRDEATIDRKVAIARNGIAEAQYSTSANNTMYIIAFLNTVIVKGPEWYERAKSNKPDIWGDIPDAAFIGEVFSGAITFRNRVQEELKGDTKHQDNPTSNPIDSNIPTPVGDGVFKGVASSTK